MPQGSSGPLQEHERLSGDAHCFPFEQYPKQAASGLPPQLGMITVVVVIDGHVSDVVVVVEVLVELGGRIVIVVTIELEVDVDVAVVGTVVMVVVELEPVVEVLVVTPGSVVVVVPIVVLVVAPGSVVVVVPIVVLVVAPG
jgi:hypothetical protein